ncbi:hypothetical protein Hanom_Chr09g00775961 [Helianthus anomalus]
MRSGFMNNAPTLGRFLPHGSPVSKGALLGVFTKGHSGIMPNIAPSNHYTITNFF